MINCRVDDDWFSLNNCRIAQSFTPGSAAVPIIVYVLPKKWVGIKAAGKVSQRNEIIVSYSSLKFS